MSQDAEALGLRIRHSRDSKNLSQQDLAEATGVHYMTISKWERGTGSPKGINLIRLAHVLGVNPNWLQTGRGPMEGPMEAATPYKAPPSIQGALASFGQLPPTQEAIIAELLMNIQMDQKLTEEQKRQTTETLIRNLLKLGKPAQE